MELNFERGDEIGREDRQLPAGYYKKILLPLSRSKRANLFIPVRSMQYLAVVEKNEIIFVDGQRPRLIELAWGAFHHDENAQLGSPVSYTVTYYTENGREAMQRLQSEFLKALELMERRDTTEDDAVVTPLKRD